MYLIIYENNLVVISKVRLRSNDYLLKKDILKVVKADNGWQFINQFFKNIWADGDTKIFMSATKQIELDSKLANLLYV